MANSATYGTFTGYVQTIMGLRNLTNPTTQHRYEFFTFILKDFNGKRCQVTAFNGNIHMLQTNAEINNILKIENAQEKELHRSNPYGVYLHLIVNQNATVTRLGRLIL
ncbi:uncharacterized protein LOC122505824 [Leptopilina heterotoma]|uniref:uncharacterized protein LOC122505824 n=1 Tax=Leptopilina heterotoma TaxID=63436 RepID=UPI001CA83373|nr:uncharacterized protein LOC122505824 [Leptopilina heterotoma]